jgi:hypothetical protein
MQILIPGPSTKCQENQVLDRKESTASFDPFFFRYLLDSICRAMLWKEA